MVGVAHAEHAADPVGEQLFNEAVLPHGAEVVHGGVDVLDLPEAGFSVGLLCPGEGAGDIGLIQHLEGQVAPHIGVKPLVAGFRLQIGRVAVPERRHRLEGFRQRGGVPVFLQQTAEGVVQGIRRLGVLLQHSNELIYCR